jgi:hypothetical protein
MKPRTVVNTELERYRNGKSASAKQECEEGESKTLAKTAAFVAAKVKACFSAEPFHIF